MFPVVSCIAVSFTWAHACKMSFLLRYVLTVNFTSQANSILGLEKYLAQQHFSYSFCLTIEDLKVLDILKYHNDFLICFKVGNFKRGCRDC